MCERAVQRGRGRWHCDRGCTWDCCTRCMVAAVARATAAAAAARAATAAKSVAGSCTKHAAAAVVKARAEAAWAAREFWRCVDCRARGLMVLAKAARRQPRRALGQAAKRRIASYLSLSRDRDLARAFATRKIRPKHDADAWYHAHRHLAIRAEDFCIAHAADEGDVEAVLRELEGGADPDTRQTGGHRPRGMHIAAKKSHVRMLHVLLAAGAAMNFGDDCGSSPLMRAAGDGQLAAMKWILAAGTDHLLHLPRANGGQTDHTGTPCVLHVVYVARRVCCTSCMLPLRRVSVASALLLLCQVWVRVPSPSSATQVAK